ncbi:MAG: glutathione peroxidase [Luteibaculum sp.]
MAILKALTKNIFSPTILPQTTSPKSIYDLSFTSIQGKPVPLEIFRGKHILFVNTASKCGFTPQLEALQNLYSKHKQWLQILGFPCNQFKGQEPGSEKEIEEFCQINYGVDFPISEKIKVKGNEVHPIYQWLKTKAQNGVLNSEVEWNFQKYWVDNTGALRAVIYTPTKPNSKRFQELIENFKP